MLTNFITKTFCYMTYSSFPCRIMINTYHFISVLFQVEIIHMSKFKLRTVEKNSTSTISFPGRIERVRDAGAMQ